MFRAHWELVGQKWPQRLGNPMSDLTETFFFGGVTDCTYLRKETKNGLKLLFQGPKWLSKLMNL